MSSSGHKRSPYSKHIRIQKCGKSFRTIFHVEYDGDAPLAIRDHLGESYKVRSTSGQESSNFDIFNFGKLRHVSGCRMSPGIQWCHLFFFT